MSLGSSRSTHDTNTSKSKSRSVVVNVNLADVLSLIPDFPGTRGEIDYVYFRAGCHSALRVLGPDHEDLLLRFLAPKLKGDARTRFGLKLGTYDRLAKLLRDLKDAYAPNSDSAAYWRGQMMELRQRNEPEQRYGALFAELLMCANLGLMWGDDELTPSRSDRHQQHHKHQHHDHNHNHHDHHHHDHNHHHHHHQRHQLQQQKSAEEVYAEELADSILRKISNDKRLDKISDCESSSSCGCSHARHQQQQQQQQHHHRHQRDNGKEPTRPRVLDRSASNESSVGGSSGGGDGGDGGEQQVQLRRPGNTSGGRNRYQLPQIEFPKSPVLGLPGAQRPVFPMADREQQQQQQVVAQVVVEPTTTTTATASGRKSS